MLAGISSGPVYDTDQVLKHRMTSVCSDDVMDASIASRDVDRSLSPLSDGEVNQTTTNSSSSRRERVLLRPWLENLINSGLIPGLEWIDVEKTTFKVPWKHRSKKSWSLEHSSVFLEWARNTGRWTEGDPEPNYAQLKTRLRCAFSKAPDIEELKELHRTKCEEPYKVYRFKPRRFRTGLFGRRLVPRTTVPITLRYRHRFRRPHIPMIRPPRYYPTDRTSLERRFEMTDSHFATMFQRDPSLSTSGQGHVMDWTSLHLARQPVDQRHMELTTSERVYAVNDDVMASKPRLLAGHESVSSLVDTVSINNNIELSAKRAVEQLYKALGNHSNVGRFFRTSQTEADAALSAAAAAAGTNVQLSHRSGVICDGRYNRHLSPQQQLLLPQHQSSRDPVHVTPGDDRYPRAAAAAVADQMFASECTSAGRSVEWREPNYDRNQELSPSAAARGEWIGPEELAAENLSVVGARLLADRWQPRRLMVSGILKPESSPYGLPPDMLTVDTVTFDGQEYTPEARDSPTDAGRDSTANEDGEVMDLSFACDPDVAAAVDLTTCRLKQANEENVITNEISCANQESVMDQTACTPDKLDALQQQQQQQQPLDKSTSSSPPLSPRAPIDVVLARSGGDEMKVWKAVEQLRADVENKERLIHVKSQVLENKELELQRLERELHERFETLQEREYQLKVKDDAANLTRPNSLLSQGSPRALNDFRPPPALLPAPVRLQTQPSGEEPHKKNVSYEMGDKLPYESRTVGPISSANILALRQHDGDLRSRLENRDDVRIIPIAENSLPLLLPSSVGPSPGRYPQNDRILPAAAGSRPLNLHEQVLIPPMPPTVSQIQTMASRYDVGKTHPHEGFQNRLRQAVRPTNEVVGLPHHDLTVLAPSAGRVLLEPREQRRLLEHARELTVGPRYPSQHEQQQQQQRYADKMYLERNSPYARMKQTDGWPPPPNPSASAGSRMWLNSASDHRNAVVIKKRGRPKGSKNRTNKFLSELPGCNSAGSDAAVNSKSDQQQQQHLHLTQGRIDPLRDLPQSQPFTHDVPHNSLQRTAGGRMLPPAGGDFPPSSHVIRLATTSSGNLATVGISGILPPLSPLQPVGAPHQALPPGFASNINFAEASLLRTHHFVQQQQQQLQQQQRYSMTSQNDAFVPARRADAAISFDRQRETVIKTVAPVQQLAPIPRVPISSSNERQLLSKAVAMNDVRDLYEAKGLGSRMLIENGANALTTLH